MYSSYLLGVCLVWSPPWGLGGTPRLVSHTPPFASIASYVLVSSSTSLCSCTLYFGYGPASV
jgi:hypothetical protein